MLTTRIYRIHQQELRSQVDAFGGQQAVARAAGISLRSLCTTLNADPFVQRGRLFAMAKAFRIAPWELCDRVVVGLDSTGNKVLADYTEAIFRSELIPGFGKAGNLIEVFRKIHQSLVKSTPDLRELDLDHATVRSFDHVEEFWGATLRDGDLVTIDGVLSPFSPLLIGNPKGLLTLHNQFRDLAEDGEIKTPLSSANMSLSAGQVAWDVGPIGAWHVLGLYESLVRNAVVVFVDRQEFSERLKPEFKVWRRDAAEACLTGRVVSLNGFGDMIDGPLGSENKELHATPRGLVVSPQLAGTSISLQPITRYLDGDLFAVVEVNGEYVLRTQPTNFSNPDVVDSDRVSLQAGINRRYPGAPVVIDSGHLEALRK